MDFIEVEIKNWEKYNPRKDIKHPTWFAFSNRTLEHPKLFTLSDAEFKAFMYILCQASQRASAKVKIYLAHAKQVCGIKEEVMASALVHLTNAGVTFTSRSRTQTCPDTTDRQTLQTDKTGKVKAPEALPYLSLVWNENCGELAKVKKTNKARNRKADILWNENSPEDWTEIVKRIAASPFCCGKNDRGWRATFDWLLQPETHLKIQEGKYDGSGGSQIDWSKFQDLEGVAK